MKHAWIIFSLAIVIFASSCNAPLDSKPETEIASGWESIFNGENLDGWTIHGDQKWAVENGVLTTIGDGTEMGWLAYEKPYSDFTLKLRFQWQAGNSGIQVRSDLSSGKMVGYQANLDPSRPTATGALVEENGRGLLQDSNVLAEECFKQDDWNDYEIRAQDDRITITVNGHQTVDLLDPDGAREGIIALQMSPGGNGAMQWKDIQIKPEN